MARGRRDYTNGFLSETGTGARYTESYLLWYANVIAGGANSTVYQYTVPAGKRLAINGFIFSTDCPILSRVLFTVDAVIKMGLHFSNFGQFPVSEQNPYYVEAGELLKLQVYNDFKDAKTYYVSIIGVLESL